MIYLTAKNLYACIAYFGAPKTQACSQIHVHSHKSIQHCKQALIRIRIIRSRVRPQAEYPMRNTTVNSDKIITL